MSEQADRDFDELVGPSAGDRARAHEATQSPAAREVQAFQAGKEAGRKEAPPPSATRRSDPTPARTPRRESSSPRVVSSGADSSWKLLILVEMVTLLGAGLVVNRADPTESFLVTLLSKPGLKRTAAVVVLLILLMIAADLGLGGPAALFGGIVVASYLMGHGAGFGPQIISIEKRAFT